MHAPEPEVQSAAMRALMRIGPGARIAVPDLIEALKSEPSRLQAMGVLRKIGPDANAAVPALADLALNGEREDDRRRALSALKLLRPEADQVAPLLARALKDERHTKIGSEFVSLARDVPGMVPYLLPLLDDPRQQTRSGAMTCLLFCKRPGAEAVPVLIRALEDTNGTVGSGAVRMLGEMGPVARPAIPALLEFREITRADHMKKAAAKAIEQIREEEPAPQ